MIEIPRRRFLAGLVGLVAAPAVIRVAKLMPVRALAEQARYIVEVSDDGINWRPLAGTIENGMFTAQEDVGMPLFREVAIRYDGWIWARTDRHMALSA